jgi:signal peptidase I
MNLALNILLSDCRRIIFYLKRFIFFLPNYGSNWDLMVRGNKLKFCIVGVFCAAAILSISLAFLPHVSFLVVVSKSMEPALHAGDIVIFDQSNSANTSFKDVKVGDIIAFEEPGKTESSREKIIVHRVVQIGDSPYGDTIVITKGDANPFPIQFVDFPITNDDYIGRVDYVIPYVGLVLMYIDILIRVAFPPTLYILIAAAAGVLIVIKVSRGKGILI